MSTYSESNIATDQATLNNSEYHDATTHNQHANHGSAVYQTGINSVVVNVINLRSTPQTAYSSFSSPLGSPVSSRSPSPTSRTYRTMAGQSPNSRPYTPSPLGNAARAASPSQSPFLVGATPDQAELDPNLPGKSCPPKDTQQGDTQQEDTQQEPALDAYVDPEVDREVEEALSAAIKSFQLNGLKRLTPKRKQPERRQ